MNETRQATAFRLFVVIVGASVIAALAKNPWFALLLMASAYVQNLTYSMASRSGVRNSYAYYAISSPLASIAFYTTLRLLIGKDMTLWFFGPYVAATVLGSITGSQVSMWVEKKFNITTRADDKDRTSRNGRVFLISILAVLMVWTLWTGAGDVKAQLLLVALVALKDMSFTLVRHSRNTNKPWYHATVTVVDGALWFFMWRELVLQKLPYTLLAPYMLGGILGGMLGQKTALVVGAKIKAKADLGKDEKKPSVVGPAFAMLVMGLCSAYLLKNFAGPMFMFGLAAIQSVSFSLVSRSRNRNNLTYHGIASIFSNGAWYLVFRNVVRKDMQVAYAPAYISGSVFGSLVGVDMSMRIERLLGATSDDHVQKK